MPELPDVEGYRRFLARNAEGRRILHVAVPDPEIVRNRNPQALGRALARHRFGASSRHGKWLIAPVGQTEVLLHFGMTGRLTWTGDGTRRHPHDRVIFVCDGGELRYNNMRRFGGIWLARDAAERLRVTGPLGVDAAQLGPDQLDDLLTQRRGAIKAALMDQRLIAGLGNLLCDEILWRARIHPRAPASGLSPARRRRLHDALQAALRESIPHGRVPRIDGWLTEVRDQPKARCPRCGTTLSQATVAGRTTRWCPHCQRLPRAPRRGG